MRGVLRRRLLGAIVLRKAALFTGHKNVPVDDQVVAWGAAPCIDQRGADLMVGVAVDPAGKPPAKGDLATLP